MLGVEDRFPAPKRFAEAFDTVHELVHEQTGLSDFGDGDYRTGLRVLLESMDYDPHFTDRGRNVAWGALLTTLGSRALAVHAMRENVAAGQMPVSGPVVITGLHRTGTTALHKLLSLDPQFQGLQSWLAASPMPRPPQEEWESQPAFQAVSRQLAARFAGSPDLRAAHHMAAEEVDECGGILFQSFHSMVWSAAWSAQSYEAWRQSADVRSAYRYLRDVLQMIGSTAADRRWLLKHPPHLENMDILFQTFPDAKVIQTHRDPAKAIPSLCSLIMANHGLMESDKSRDRRARLMGPWLTGWGAHAMRSAEPVRQARAAQILDIVHADFHARPMDTVKRIYTFLALELAPEVEATMAERVAAKPEFRHGAHRYCAGDYGLDEQAIREEFGDYVERFDLVAREKDTKAA